MTVQYQNIDRARLVKTWEKGCPAPLVLRYRADLITPVQAYLRLRRRSAWSFLLESVEKGRRLGRYSFIGVRPQKAICTSFQRNFNTIAPPAAKNQHICWTDPESFFCRIGQELRRWNIQPENVKALPRFNGGAVGYIGYDMVRTMETLPGPGPDTCGIPDAAMGVYTELAAFDHLHNELLLLAWPDPALLEDIPAALSEAHERLALLADGIVSQAPHLELFSCDPSRWEASCSREQFEQMVRRAKEYIFAGDIFQVVLSQRFHVPFAGDPFQVYRTLRQINPSPYMFYLDFGSFQLVGASPEPLIRGTDRNLEIIPIAGTRPRGNTPEEDVNLERELLQDSKERAEHVMLVDLARNDLARVSEYGSVHVEEFATVERYSHVMHIISRVRSVLRRNLSPIDAFKAAFPAGTVSGAPKVRAMEIIDELEVEKRSFYAGAAGYFGFGGTMDLCIAIRTLLACGNRLYIQAGAGIVADSVPEREYRETLNKMQALKVAVEKAGENVHDLVH